MNKIFYAGTFAHHHSFELGTNIIQPPVDVAESDSTERRKQKSNLRWWPGILFATASAIAVVWVRLQTDWPFQHRNLIIAQIVLLLVILLLLWWTFFSRASNRLRLRVTYGLVGALVVGAALFRVSGVSGDLVPIFEFRWANRNAPTIQPVPSDASIPIARAATNDFPQFRGANRDGVLAGPHLETNWPARPPQIIWRQNVGAAWSGFAVVGDICLTQEQRGEDECVVARKLGTGQELWLHSDKARFNNIVAGEGPRATPTVVSNHVFTCGSTGIINCFDLLTGKIIWRRDLLAEGGEVPDWGVASSPLCVEGLVIVHGGEGARNSLHAFRADDGKPVWSGGIMEPSYASPSFATLAGVPQILAFNDGAVSSHDLTTGAMLWQRPWGNGNAVCASPVVISENQVLFSSGYGVGAELLEISRTNSRFVATPVWKSIRMKAKFSHMFARDGFLYGLDDGIFACVDLQNGSQKWKEGRYGHGQGLAVGELYLLMAESGELVLLRSTPDAPNELARFRVFNSKTWNPIALAGDFLLVRNDREAALLKLTLVTE